MRSRLPLADVVDGGARLERARVHAEVGELTDERVGHDLEGQRREGRVVGGGALDDVVGLGVHGP